MVPMHDLTILQDDCDVCMGTIFVWVHFTTRVLVLAFRPHLLVIVHSTCAQTHYLLMGHNFFSKAVDYFKASRIHLILFQWSLLNGFTNHVCYKHPVRSSAKYTWLPLNRGPYYILMCSVIYISSHYIRIFAGKNR